MSSAKQTDHDFDFDSWMQMAKQSPADFEAFRQKEIERIIQRGSDPQPLLKLQFRIDAERLRSRTPLMACLCLSSLMWDGFLELHAVSGNGSHHGS